MIIKISRRTFRSIALSIGTAITLLMTGCATLFTGTTDEINFTSNVDHVRVYVAGRLVGETPLKTVVKRQIGQGPQIKFEKEGYETQEFFLEKEFNWVSILDVSAILTSGGIDVLTGAVLKYSRNSYHVEMLSTRSTSLDAHDRQIQFAKFVLLNADKIRADLAGDGGEYSRSLVSLVSAQGFESWLLSQKDPLISASDPELLLSALRQSHMTP